MKNDWSWNLGGDYVAHYGVSVANGAKVGSGRYRLGSGRDPYQHGQLKSAGDYRRALNRFDTDRAQYQANADRAALKANKQNAKANKVIARAYSSADFDGDVNTTVDNKKLSKIRAKQREYESERDQNQAKANAVSDKINQVIKDAESDDYDVNSKQVQKFADTGSLFIAQVVGGLPASVGYYAATAKYNNQIGNKYSVKKGQGLKEEEAKSGADFDGDTVVPIDKGDLTVNTDKPDRDWSGLAKAIYGEDLSADKAKAKIAKDPTVDDESLALAEMDLAEMKASQAPKKSSSENAFKTVEGNQRTTAKIGKDKVELNLSSSSDSDSSAEGNKYWNTIKSSKMQEEYKEYIAKNRFDTDPESFGYEGGKADREKFKKNLHLYYADVNPEANMAELSFDARDDGGNSWGEFVMETSVRDPHQKGRSVAFND